MAAALQLAVAFVCVPCSVLAHLAATGGLPRCHVLATGLPCHFEMSSCTLVKVYDFFKIKRSAYSESSLSGFPLKAMRTASRAPNTGLCTTYLPC